MADAIFEIPQSLRDLSEQNLKQAHAAYDQLMSFVAKAIDGWMEANPVSVGFKDVHERVMQFAKDNADEAFTFFSHISNAQTLSEALALQTQFAQDRIQSFTTQAQEILTLIEDALQKAEGSGVENRARNITSDPMAISFTFAGLKDVRRCPR